MRETAIMTLHALHFENVVETGRPCPVVDSSGSITTLSLRPWTGTWLVIMA
jgi:hypothetical protein